MHSPIQKKTKDTECPYRMGLGFNISRKNPIDFRSLILSFESLILIFTADQTRRRGRGPGRDAVCRADEKQTEYKSLRTRREL